MHQAYSECQLCPRGCKVNRENGQTGVCKVTSTLKVSRAVVCKPLMSTVTFVSVIRELWNMLLALRLMVQS